eukprot:6432576-Amphidinium_carterae.1
MKNVMKATQLGLRAQTERTLAEQSALFAIGLHVESDSLATEAKWDLHVLSPVKQGELTIWDTELSAVAMTVRSGLVATIGRALVRFTMRNSEV